MKNLIILAIFSVIILPKTNAASLVGRLGVGMTDHLVTGQKALSVKLQRSRSSALGGHFSLDSSDDGIFYGLGLKAYRYIYEEPQLNFYSAISGTYLTFKDESTDDSLSGYQIDGTLGAEFSFQGLESIGFSFEFGVGLSNYQDETQFKTLGHSMVASAVHFYL